MIDADDNTPREHHITNGESAAHHPPDVMKRLDRLERAIDEQRLESALTAASRRTWRWVLGLAVPALLAAMFALLLSAVDKLSTAGERAGESKAKIEALDRRVEALDRRIDGLQRDINTLILELRKLSGTKPHDSISVVAATAP